MSAFFVFKKLVALFTDPLTLICVIGLFVAIAFKFAPVRIKKIRYPLFLVGFALLWILSTPSVSFYLMSPLEQASREKLFQPDTMSADAILVLGCGHSESEYVPLSSRYQECSMRRIVHAVLLHKETSLPIVFSGGKMPGKRYSEANFNRRLAFKLGVNIQDTRLSVAGMDTRSEAEALAKDWIGKTLVLVTSASHMRRSTIYMEREGLMVYQSPTHHSLKVKDLNYASIYAYLPRWTGLKRTSSVLYERLGLVSQAWFE